jgi:imidazolonepropionase-like amidohydrolase
MKPATRWLKSVERWQIALLVIGLAACAGALGSGGQPSGTRSERVTAFVNGHWFDGTRFQDGTRYSAGGNFVKAPAHRPDSVVDLGGGYVVPPFGEAHNHNIDASSDSGARALVTRYLRDGVFYAQNPCNVVRARRGLMGFINLPSGIDATFSNACITAPGGHPMGLYLRNLARGGMLPTDSNSTEGFLWTVRDREDLNRKWPLILASKPDFVKTMLLYSEEYERRKNDSAFFNWRGLDPAVLTQVVRLAHAAGLRVMTHIETAADFRNALLAGADEIGHTPGFRGNEKTQLPDLTPYLISDADAREAARRGVFVITTLGGAQTISRTGPDSVFRRRLDSLATTNLRTLKRHGVQIAIGSDSYRNTSVPEAMYLSSLGVFSNAELLNLWTDVTARAIFPRRKLGRLAPGYEASMLVLDANPLTDFQSVRRIRMRVKQGQVLAVAAIN